jgi:superfamily II DNA or RNA helicase
MAKYHDFLRSKEIRSIPTGIPEPSDPPSMLFPFQRDIVKWALRRGRAAIFADCGMGKTAMQLSWAAQVPGNVLILAPLAVAQQTIREGQKFGIEVKYSRGEKTDSRITITNYEMLEKFNPSAFTGIVLDESSIIKAYDGKFRNLIIESFRETPFKLACTATPAPNDWMELGNHAEFLGVLSRTEMLSTFFVHDGGDTSQWRLKGHASRDFWRWICSWAVMIRKPSDLGYEDGNFTLPDMKMHSRIVEAQHVADGALFALEATTLQERQQARKLTTQERCEAVAEIVASRPDEPWLIWCNLNDESQTVTNMIPGAVEVTGSDSPETKETRMLGFSAGSHLKMVSKPSICGFGMNWQHCANVVFLGLSDSYEQFYQAVRRCWRFGQTKTVNVWIVTSDIEGAVVENIRRKEYDAARMAEEMVSHMHGINESDIRGTVRTNDSYSPQLEMIIPEWLETV